MTVTDEQIAAYADGELTGTALAEAEAAIEADPALAAKVEAHRALKSRLGAHFAPVLDQEVPAHLSAMLAPKQEAASQPAELVSFARERQKRGLAPAVRRWGVYLGPAMAAAVVAAVVLTPFGGAGDPPIGSETVGPQLAAALDTQLAGEAPEGSSHRILLSFEGEDDVYCRVYRSDDAGGIACREDGDWKVEEEMHLAAGQNTEFRQAGSEADLLAAAQDMATGGALDGEQEAAARAEGWQR